MKRQVIWRPTAEAREAWDGSLSAVISIPWNRRWCAQVSGLVVRINGRVVLISRWPIDPAFLSSWTFFVLGTLYCRA